MLKIERINALPDDIKRQIQTMAINNLRQGLIMEAAETLYYHIYRKDDYITTEWEWNNFDSYGDKSLIIIQIKKLKRLEALTSQIIDMVYDWLECENYVMEFADNYGGYRDKENEKIFELLLTTENSPN